MAEHDPPALVIPSKGKTRLSTTGEQPLAPGHAAGRPGRGADDDDETETENDERAAGSTNKKGSDVTAPAGSANTWQALVKCFESQDLYLDNVGSVARDHLANERTFLAWLRTSLSLASIGVAITQLFRLTSSSYTLPSGSRESGSSDSSSASRTDLVIQAIAQADLPEAVSSLLAAVQRQQADILSLGLSTGSERNRYNKLGKPIGGTFLMLGIVFVVLGGNRYLSVQHHLSSKNIFPPARRSILISSMLVMALLVAAFASIIAVA